MIICEAFDVDINSDCLCGRCVQCNAWDWQLVGREDVKDNPQVRFSYPRMSPVLFDDGRAGRAQES